MDTIEFLRDIPYSESNSEIYKNIYRVEQWLRRITYTSLRISYSIDDWIDSIPSEILNELKKRRGSLRGRILLDCENNQNIIWLSTIDELSRLMTMDSIWLTIKSLTGFTKDELREKINLLREIRNIVNHNRATTYETLNICNGILRYFDKGINKFKNKVFYNEKLINDAPDIYTLPAGGEYFYSETEHFVLIERCQMLDYHIGDGVFHEFPCVNIAELLEIFKEMGNVIIAITVCEEEGSNYDAAYGVICPRNYCNVKHYDNIVDIMNNAESHIWDQKNYLTQSAKHLCDPKIWFHASNPDTDDKNVSEIPEQEIIQGDSNIISFPRK
jgi:hypothetical protein